MNSIRKQQYTVTLFDCSHLEHVIVLWQMPKFMCYCVVAFFYFEYEGNFQVQAPGDYILRDDLTEGFFEVSSFGGLYLEGLIFGILRWSVYNESLS